MSLEERFYANQKLVYLIYHRSFQNYSNYEEDLIQEGMLGLWKSCLSFREDNGTAFSTYACVAIQRQMWGFIKQTVIKHQSCVSLETVIAENSDGDEITLSDALGQSDNIFTQCIVEDCIQQLLPRERRIIHLLIKGKTQNAIADICGISQSTVSRCLIKFKSIYTKESRDADT